MSDVKCPACSADLTFIRVRGYGDLYQCVSDPYRRQVMHYRRKDSKALRLRCPFPQRSVWRVDRVRYARDEGGVSVENLKHIDVQWMSNEDRAHLLQTVLSVLPPGHELRVRIESIFARIKSLAVRLDMPMTQAEKLAFIADGDTLNADLRRAAIEAYRFVQ